MLWSVEGQLSSSTLAVSKLVSVVLKMAPNHPDTPNRSYMDNPDIEWRSVKPNYDATNQKYLNERSRFHKAGSLEKLVEDLVKTWEMESTHKINAKVTIKVPYFNFICNYKSFLIKDWKTIDVNRYSFSTNGGPKKDLEANILNGNYNMMMESSPLFDVSKETNASSHALFKSAFPDGFAWELLEILSGKKKNLN